MQKKQRLFVPRLRRGGKNKDPGLETRLVQQA